MKRLKTRVFAGAVCEQYVYNVPERADPKKYREPKPRFANDQERQAHRLAISMRKNRRLINDNFSPLSLYSTLTFDQDNECHTVAECKAERDKYVRRLRHKYPNAKIYIVYGRGKHTNRFHLHMISDGIPEEAIGEMWGRGSVIDVKHLRAHNYYKNDKGQKVDHGADFSGLADYLFSHWREEFGGHRWKCTRNVKEPEPEEPTIAVRDYDLQHPPIAPKGYVLTDARLTQYGYMHFTYCRIPEEDLGKRPKRALRLSLVNV